MRLAANLVAAGSRIRRTCTSSSVKSSSSRSAAAPMPASSSSGRKLVTNVPSPRRISRTRAVTRARTASRIVLRPVPSDSASSASGGSRSPGDRLPEAMSSRTCSIAASVNEAAIVGSPPLHPYRDQGLDMGCLSAYGTACRRRSTTSGSRTRGGADEHVGERRPPRRTPTSSPRPVDDHSSTADSVDGEPHEDVRSAGPLSIAPWRPDRDPTRTGPHPRRPRPRHDAPVAGVPHHRQRRQHPVADGGNRLAGDRPAARHHHQGHRSVGRLDAGTRLGARRPRLPQRQRRRGGHRRDARHRRGGRLRQRRRIRLGPACRIRSSSRWRR